MKMTIDEVRNLLKDMEENKVDSITFDFNSYEPIEVIDFDMWENGRFIKTLLTIEREGIDK